jgi:hypothetical protein
MQNLHDETGLLRRVPEWIKGNMREEHRPDKTMVVLDYFKLPEGLPGGTLQIWEVSEGRLRSDYVLETTRNILKEGMWVSHLPIHGRKKMFVPKGGILDEDIVAALKKEDFEIVEFSP